MSQRAKNDISNFNAELTQLLSQYSDAGYCPGCMSEALIKSAVAMVVTADSVCWPAGYPKEVELITALAKLIAHRPIGVPSGETLQ